VLDAQNQGPQCTACGSPMRLAAIEPSYTGRDLRTFTCPHCSRVQRHIIESTVTKAWLEPKRAVELRQRKAVTHEVSKGRLIPKSAKSGPDGEARRRRDWSMTCANAASFKPDR
jgi:hypothetical protein